MVEYPEWYDGKNVNEVKFCEEFLKIHPMKSVNGTFFTVEGRVTDEDALRREIYESLKPFFQTGLTKRVANLLEALRLEAYAPDLPIQRDRIHVEHFGSEQVSNKYVNQNSPEAQRSGFRAERKNKCNGVYARRLCRRAKWSEICSDVAARARAASGSCSAHCSARTWRLAASQRSKPAALPAPTWSTNS